MVYKHAVGSCLVQSLQQVSCPLAFCTSIAPLHTPAMWPVDGCFHQFRLLHVSGRNKKQQEMVEIAINRPRSMCICQTQKTTGNDISHEQATWHVYLPHTISSRKR